MQSDNNNNNLNVYNVDDDSNQQIVNLENSMLEQDESFDNDNNYYDSNDLNDSDPNQSSLVSILVNLI